MIPSDDYGYQLPVVGGDYWLMRNHLKHPKHSS